jgi:hypothetical protein
MTDKTPAGQVTSLFSALIEVNVTAYEEKIAKRSSPSNIKIRHFLTRSFALHFYLRFAQSFFRKIKADN